MSVIFYSISSIPFIAQERVAFDTIVKSSIVKFQRNFSLPTKFQSTRIKSLTYRNKVCLRTVFLMENWLGCLPEAVGRL